MPTTADYEPIRFNLIAGALAYLVPGAGHVFLGQTARGLVIGAGILALFFGGLFIGGLSVVDSRSGRLENRISFYGQAIVGPAAIAVDRVHQAMFKGYDPATRRVRALNPGEVRIAPGDPRNPNGFALIARADPARGEGPPYERSQGKVHEIGLLYTVLAGMLNFIVIIDAAFPGGRLKPRPPRGQAFDGEAHPVDGRPGQLEHASRAAEGGRA
jgi:hypothetical protein